MSQCFPVPVHHSPQLNANLSTWGLFQPPLASPYWSCDCFCGNERPLSAVEFFLANNRKDLTRARCASDIEIGRVVLWGVRVGGSSLIQCHWELPIKAPPLNGLKHWSQAARGPLCLRSALPWIRRDEDRHFCYNVGPACPAKDWRSFLSSHFSIVLFVVDWPQPSKWANLIFCLFIFCCLFQFCGKTIHFSSFNAYQNIKEFSALPGREVCRSKTKIEKSVRTLLDPLPLVFNYNVSVIRSSYVMLVEGLTIEMLQKKPKEESWAVCGSFKCIKMHSSCIKLAFDTTHRMLI